MNYRSTIAEATAASDEITSSRRTTDLPLLGVEDLWDQAEDVDDF